MGDLEKYKRREPKSSFPYGNKRRQKVVTKLTFKKRDRDPASVRTLSDKELEKMTTKELNDYTRKISKQQAQRLKKRRRILKNRRYASKCRQKSIQKRDTVMEENQSLEKELSATKRELKTILKERDYYRSKYVQLYNHAFETFPLSTATKAKKLAD